MTTDELERTLAYAVDSAIRTGPLDQTVSTGQLAVKVVFELLNRLGYEVKKKAA